MSVVQVEIMFGFLFGLVGLAGLIYLIMSLAETSWMQRLIFGYSDKDESRLMEKFIEAREQGKSFTMNRWEARAMRETVPNSEQFELRERANVERE